MKLPFIAVTAVLPDQTCALRCSLYDLLPPMHADAPWYGMAVSVVGITAPVYKKVSEALVQATLPREFDGEADDVHTLLVLVNVFAPGLKLSDVDGRPWRRLNTFYLTK